RNQAAGPRERHGLFAGILSVGMAVLFHFETQMNIRRHDQFDRQAVQQGAQLVALACVVGGHQKTANDHERISRSAQTACSRSMGSVWSGASVKAGMAACSFKLPSATATLRKYPRRLARLTGLDLNLSRNS